MDYTTRKIELINNSKKIIKVKVGDDILSFIFTRRAYYEIVELTLENKISNPDEIIRILESAIESEQKETFYKILEEDFYEMEIIQSVIEQIGKKKRTVSLLKSEA